MKQQKLSSFISQNEHEVPLVSLSAFDVIGMEIIFEPDNDLNYSRGRTLWQAFNRNLPKISNRIRRQQWEKFGIRYHFFDESQKRRTKYLACVEISDLTLPPPSMVRMRIPKNKWQQFQHHGRLKDLSTTLNTISSHRKNNQKASVQAEINAKKRFIDHIERYDHRFHWTHPSSEIDLFFPLPQKC